MCGRSDKPSCCCCCCWCCCWWRWLSCCNERARTGSGAIYINCRRAWPSAAQRCRVFNWTRKPNCFHAASVLLCARLSSCKHCQTILAGSLARSTVALAYCVALLSRTRIAGAFRIGPCLRTTLQHYRFFKACGKQVTNLTQNCSQCPCPGDIHNIVRLKHIFTTKPCDLNLDLFKR